MQIGDNRQNVLVDSVLMEEIVLHLPHDFSEIGQVPAEDSQLVQVLQRPGGETGRFQNAEEKRLVGRIASEIPVNVC